MGTEMCIKVCEDGEGKSYGGQVIDVTDIYPQYSYIQ